MDKKYQRLMKNSGIFMIANFGSKLFSFILVPFYTHVLSSGEYGTVDALVATVALFSPIVTLGIGDVMVMFLSRKEYEVKKIFTNAAAVIIFGNIMVALVYPLLFLVDIFRDYRSYFVILVVTSSVYAVLQMYARGTGKIAACAASGVIYTVTLACSNIVLLLWMDMGISGYLASTVLAYLIPAIYLFAIVPGKCFRVTLLDKTLIRNLLQLSIPLIPTGTLWVLMNLADKYAILWSVGASGNGVYAVAHKIPSIISVLYGIFQQAWQLTTFELQDRDERSDVYTKIFELFTCVMFTVGAALIIVNRLYIVKLCDYSYAEAWKVSPILMYSAVLNCISGFLESSYLIMHNTKAILKVTAIGALVNVILNFILVPVFGLYGAAAATCIGYLCMVGQKYCGTVQFTPLKISIKRFFAANMLLILMCVSVTIRNSVGFYIVNALLVVCMLLIYRDQFSKVMALILGKFRRKES